MGKSGGYLACQRTCVPIARLDSRKPEAPCSRAAVSGWWILTRSSQNQWVQSKSVKNN